MDGLLGGGAWYKYVEKRRSSIGGSGNKNGNLITNKIKNEQDGSQRLDFSTYSFQHFSTTICTIILFSA